MKPGANITFNGGNVLDLPNGTANTDPMTIWQGRDKLNKSGDTMTGVLNVVNGTGQAAASYAQTIGVSSIFNVKNYGAAGDGISDDADNIQLAVDAAANAGGGIVYIPAGNYSLATTQNISGYELILIRPRSNVYFKGAGKGTTTLRIANNIRTAYIGCSPIMDWTDTPVDNWGISDMTVDFNGQNNLIPDHFISYDAVFNPNGYNGSAGSLAAKWSQIGAMNCSNVTLERLELKNCPSMNVIILNGYNLRETGKNGIVRDCVITNSGNDIVGNEIYDFTAIYTDLENMVIENNIIEAIDMRDENCAAIEVHAPSSTVRNNRIKNYRHGIMIGSDGAYRAVSYDVEIYENTLTNMDGNGIIIWGMGNTYNNVRIYDNYIHMLPLTGSGAIGIVHGMSGPAWQVGQIDTKVLDVTDNQIVFDSTQDTANCTTYGMYLGYASSTRCENNRVENSSETAIKYLGGSSGSVTASISGNKLIQCGEKSRTVYIVSVNAAYDIKWLAVANNEIFKTTAKPVYYDCGIAITAPVKISGSIHDNLIEGMYYRVYPISIGAGSSLRIESRETTYPHTGYGTYCLGSIIWNSAPVAGGTPGWICTTSGSPGTWTAMANLSA
jgi:hypothetical protein